jgi:hypothetical protein
VRPRLPRFGRALTRLLCCRSRTRGRRARFYPLREDHLIGVLTMNRKTSGEFPPETAFHSRPAPVPELWCNARKPSIARGDVELA